MCADHEPGVEGGGGGADHHVTPVPRSAQPLARHELAAVGGVVQQVAPRVPHQPRAQRGVVGGQGHRALARADRVNIVTSIVIINWLSRPRSRIS